MRKRSEIKAELSAELSLEAPDLERVRELTAELEAARRPWRRRVRDEAVPEQPADPEAEALSTWPMELRARLHRSAASRVIDGSTLDDPDSWGVKNDLHRRGARP